MVKRLLLVYNPRSSHHEAIKREVLAPLRDLKGWMVGKYMVKAQDWQRNKANLAQIISDGDLVIVAGGDGTAAMAANAVLTSGKDVTFSALGYGNFNDVAEMLGTADLRKGDGIRAIIGKFEQQEFKTIYPLEVKIDHAHWRYALCYLTVGMMAAATTVFETPETRRKLMTGKKGVVFSVLLLAGWYFRNLGRRFLPLMQLNRQELSRKTSDYFAVNSPRVAKMMRGGNWCENEREFASAAGRLGGLFGLLRFMLRSMTKEMPLNSTDSDYVEFLDDRAKVVLQTEGESETFEKLQKIEVKKAQKTLRIVRI